MVPGLSGVETEARVEVFDLDQLPTRVVKGDLTVVALTAAVGH